MSAFNHRIKPNEIMGIPIYSIGCYLIVILSGYGVITISIIFIKILLSVFGFCAFLVGAYLQVKIETIFLLTDLYKNWITKISTNTF